MYLFNYLKVAWIRNDIPLVKGGMKITSDPRIQMIIDTDVKKLHIRDIKTNYSGEYHCVEYHYGEIKNVTIVAFDVIVVGKYIFVDNSHNNSPETDCSCLVKELILLEIQK